MLAQSPHNAKIVDQHTKQAEGYAKLTQGITATDRRAVLRDLLGIRPDDTLLDVACGPGFLALDLAPYLAKATGLDLTSGMLAQARKAQAERDIANVEWIEGDAANMPFPDACFSIVACSAAFHHFEEPRAVLAEMARVCRHDGRIVVSDVTPDSYKAAAYDRMERMRDPSHRHAHSLAELIDLGAGFGLAVTRTLASLTGPMPFESVLATSHPETHSREELLEMMRKDAISEADQLGFRAEIRDGVVHVTYPLSIICWTKAASG